MLRKAMLLAFAIVAGESDATFMPEASLRTRAPEVRTCVIPGECAWDIGSLAGQPNVAPAFAATLGGPLPSLTALVVALGHSP